MSDAENTLDGFPVVEFDPGVLGEVTVDPETMEVMEGEDAGRNCIGMQFPWAWWPKGCKEAGYWGGCTLIAWRYPPGNYLKPDGSAIQWGGGHSPFRRTC